MAIKDQSQFRKMEIEFKSLKYLNKLGSIISVFGKRGNDISIALSKAVNEDLPAIEREFYRLRDLPDDFNNHFIEKGWVASNTMSAEAMEESIRIYTEDGIDKAEEYLVEHYNENIDVYFMQFWSLVSIANRKKIIKLALEDHKAERYHASVPVILAQIDGIVFDLANKSFYQSRESNTSHLVANETVVGDTDGLPALALLLSKGRNSTTDSPISLPFRHGILHGRDLGYATRVVSTKALATLFALREWIVAVEKGEQFKEPENFLDPETATWEDVKESWREIWETLTRLSKR
jgi:hypothetical protein